MEITFERRRIGTQASNAQVFTVSAYTLLVDGFDVGEVEQYRSRDYGHSWALYVRVDTGLTCMTGSTRKSVAAQLERNFRDYKSCMYGACNVLTRGDSVCYTEAGHQFLEAHQYDFPTPAPELDWNAEQDYDDLHAQYDDDPNPYHGDYSEC